jgi:hypothetical protein
MAFFARMHRHIYSMWLLLYAKQMHRHIYSIWLLLCCCSFDLISVIFLGVDNWCCFGLFFLILRLFITGFFFSHPHNFPKKRKRKKKKEKIILNICDWIRKKKINKNKNNKRKKKKKTKKKRKKMCQNRSPSYFDS